MIVLKILAAPFVVVLTVLAAVFRTGRRTAYGDDLSQKAQNQ